MGVPPASPSRFKIQSSAVPTPPPQPTFRGRFEEIDAQTAADPDERKKALWEHCMAVVSFLQSDLEPRLRMRLGTAMDTIPANRTLVSELSKAETALTFNLSGIQGYDPSRDYEGPASGAFDYVRNGKADAFVDRLLLTYRGDPIPMPDPRADPDDYNDWVQYHPVSGGRRHRRKTHRRRGKRTYRHSVRKRQG